LTVEELERIIANASHSISGFMSQMAVLDSPRMALQDKAFVAAPPKAVAAGAWRFQRREENLTGWSWMVAITGSFLLVGLVGAFLVEAPLAITLSGRAGQGASDTNSTELTMAELQAMEEEPEIQPQEQVTPEEVPQPIEVPVELPELPELAEALVTEDVFTVPAAPEIETMVKPIDPAKPKPKPKVVVAQPRPRRATSTAAVTPGGTQGSGGGSGGSGAVGSGSGKGKFPKPNYPSTARARGVTGQVTLALSINPAGQVENASAVSSQGGFNSQEQDTIAGFVRRNWQFPTGSYRKHTVNIVFNLRSR
jgi:protein TonB